MFPEITRDEVFRLETRRMWLRWPSVGDAAAKSAGASPSDLVPSCALMPDRRAIATRRRENAAGSALHLVLTGRGSDRTPFGAVSLSATRERPGHRGLVLQGWLTLDHRGCGLMTEAVQAIVDAGFMLTDAPLVAASARVLDPGFRRVLDRCGFSYSEAEFASAAESGLAPSDRFRLDRKTWTSRKARRIPSVARRREDNQALCPA